MDWLAYFAGGGPFGYIGTKTIPSVAAASKVFEVASKIPAVQKGMEGFSASKVGQSYSDLMSLVLASVEGYSTLRGGAAAARPILASKLMSLLPLTLPFWGGAALRGTIGELGKVLEDKGLVKVEPPAWEKPAPTTVIIDDRRESTSPVPPIVPDVPTEQSLLNALMPALATAIARYAFTGDSTSSVAGLYGGGAPFFPSPKRKKKKKEKKNTGTGR
jgi:hypothetical protein